MNVKEFLEQAINLNGLINTQLAELEYYRRLSLNIGSSRLEEHISRSQVNEGPYAKWVERIRDKENEINAEIDRLVSIKFEIGGFIDKLDNPKWQRVLRSRYILGLSWSKIAEDMGCSLRHIQRLHKEILKKLENDTVCHRMS